MKKFFLTTIVGLIFILPCFAQTDRVSEDYLKKRKHFSPMTYFAENAVEKILKKNLKKTSKTDYKIKLKAYTLSSLKRGIFKYAEFTTNDIVVEEIPIKEINIKTETDYNWIDYRQNPIICKSDMIFLYTLYLTEDSVNQALRHKEYYKTLQKVNQRAYPLFVLHDVRVKVFNEKMKIMMDYSLPLANNGKVKTFSVTTDFVVKENLVKAYNIAYDKAYGNLGDSKIANLVNLLDPLSFTLKILNTKKCNTRIENVKIIDNIIQINGKIFVKADG